MDEDDFLPEYNILERVALDSNQLKFLTPNETLEFQIKKILMALKENKNFSNIISDQMIFQVGLFTTKVDKPLNKNYLAYVMGYIFYNLMSYLSQKEAIKKCLDLTTQIPLEIGEIQKFDTLRYIRYWILNEEIE